MKKWIATVYARAGVREHAPDALAPVLAHAIGLVPILVKTLAAE